MTKDELKKEATEYALELGDKTDGTYACCRDGYLAGAEPREKRIAELEKENAELRKVAEFQQSSNKANEWHYVKDGDLPKETSLLMSKTLLLVTQMKGSDCLSLALGQYNFSTQEFSYQHIVGLTDVIAWKEIVLPKENE